MAKTNYLEMLKLQREELDRKNNLVTLSEQYNKMKISKEKEHLQRLYENMNKFEVQKQQELKYRNDIKHSLLHEFFSALMESSTNKFLYKQYTPLITNLIESYINEKGESVILNSFNNSFKLFTSTATLLLAMRTFPLSVLPFLTRRNALGQKK